MSKQKKNQSNKSNDLDSIGSRIQAALTQQEILQLLDALFTTLPDDLRSKALAQLSLNTQDILQQILNPQQIIEQDQEIKSTAKLAQTWWQLWQEWNHIIWQASLEKGKYIAQEADWEEPYFDNYTFVEDLEQVAQKMKPLVQTAFENCFNPNDGFASSLFSAESEISDGIPDWMEIHDGIHLEFTVTTCLLHWEWLLVREQEQDAFVFAQKIREWEEEFLYVSLDGNAVTDFFLQLPDIQKQCILAGMTTNKESSMWKAELENAYSHWHHFYMEAVQQYESPEIYLENLRATIWQQWQNALLVIEDLIAKQDFVASLSVIEETLDSLLKSKHIDHPWSPENSLLFTIVDGSYGNNDNWENEKNLLSYYQQVSVGLGQSERIEALKIQLIIFESCFDWSIVFETFAQIHLSPTIHQSLFQSWRDYIIRRTKPPHYIGLYQSFKSVDKWWLHWLIDCAASPSQDATYFQHKILQWLTNLPGDRGQLGEEYNLLRLLTKDVTEIYYQAKPPYPKFYEIVIRPKDFSYRDDACRQSYLRQYAHNNLWDKVMAYWKIQLHNFVPKPELSQNSNYTEHAQWMTALSELAPQDYKKLLSKWKVEHQRRRNLWKAMENLGLG